MSNSDIKSINKKIASNNYLSNGYKHLTRRKSIHFFIILIEMVLNTLQEIFSFLRYFYSDSTDEHTRAYNIISLITTETNKLKEIVKLCLIILFVLIFDLVYIF
jgi:hypothetical protein